MNDDELKFVYFCPKCGQRFVTDFEADWTCDENCLTRLHPFSVEYWDCNGEFEYEEPYADYVNRLLEAE